jgi:hypothetical protein
MPTYIGPDGQRIGATYRVVRFHFDENHPDHRREIASGLTLEEAQAHCKRDDTKGDGWFDGYDEESP